MALRKDLLRNKARIFVFDEATAQKKFVELTVVDSFEMVHPMNPVEIKTPSGITIYRSVDMDARASFDWFHPGNLTAIERMMRGPVTKTTYDGSTAQAETVVVNFRAANDSFVLPGFDGDKTVVTVSAVVLHSTPATTYTVTTDYTLGVDTATGMSYITQVSGGSIPLNTEIRVTYSYTPLASTILKPVENAEQHDRFFVIDTFVDPADLTKYRRYFLPRCRVVSDLMHRALEVGKDNTSPNIMPVTLEYSKPETGSNEASWYWIDTYMG